MIAAHLRQFLTDRIPLTRAMHLDVVDATTDGVTLSAPLAPNVNHRDTAFGGSASALAILSAWALLYIRLKDAFPTIRIVIQRNTMTYGRPITGAFLATSSQKDDEAWARFEDGLRRKRRARIHVEAVVRCGGEEVGHLDASFVADVIPLTS